LAQALRERGAEVAFVSQAGPGDCISVIEANGFAVSPPLAELPAGSDVAIVDHYDLDQAWESAAAKGGAAVVAIDDLANRRHNCKVLLDQNITATQPGRYDGLVPEDCTLLLGPQYALLRPEFTRAPRRERTGEVRRIAISFGGFDDANATAMAIRAILHSRLGNVTVDVVLDDAAPHAREVRALCSEKASLHYRGAVANMAALLADADMAIGACGISQWERAYLGVPTLLVTVADNQLPAAQRCAEAGVASHAGQIENLTDAKLARSIEALVSDRSRLQQYSRASLQLMGDGNGAAVVADSVLSMENR
jgi:UDP-2,4-diacetamido-2,4,6-trideoxy-beta-L-altropyranose hydrolase